MKRLLLAVALLGLPSAAGSAWFLRASPSPLAEPKRLYDAGNYPEVIARLTPATMQKLRSEDLKLAYLYLGGSYEHTGRRGEALGVYQVAVKLFPGDATLLTSLAALLHEADLEEEARPLYEKILQLEPDNAEAHLGLAEIDRSLGLLDRSAQHYEKALEKMAERANVWRDYAEVLLAQRDARTAELAVRRALALSADVDSWIDLAFIARAQGRLDDALTALDKASASQTPARAGIGLARTLWLLEAGRNREASAACEEILKDSPDEPLARWVRGMLRLKAGRQESAAKEFALAAFATREAPFTARISAALLERLKGRR